MGSTCRVTYGHPCIGYVNFRSCELLLFGLLSVWALVPLNFVPLSVWVLTINRLMTSLNFKIFFSNFKSYEQKKRTLGENFWVFQLNLLPFHSKGHAWVILKFITIKLKTIYTKLAHSCFSSKTIYNTNKIPSQTM